jgi:UTP:GlnB (protein PII) uridylyltransferase
VKRGPGGLRDLQRALSVSTLASGRPATPTQSQLIAAHRFLWLLRCHLHLVVGRAEDRFTLALQPVVARRLGLGELSGTGPAPLLNIFRHHAYKVCKGRHSRLRSLNRRCFQPRFPSLSRFEVQPRGSIMSDLTQPPTIAWSRPHRARASAPAQRCEAAR